MNQERSERQCSSLALPPGLLRAAGPQIALSLSWPIAEPIGHVIELMPLTYCDFLHVAKSTEYDAICPHAHCQTVRTVRRFRTMLPHEQSSCPGSALMFGQLVD